MKTIRTNTFETNSSSTHSVTIQTKGRKNKKILEPLVENNILYPARLGAYENSAGESSFLCCDTKDMKAAVIAHWIDCRKEDDLSEVTGKKAEDLLVSLCGYNGLDWEGGSYQFYPTTEYDAGDEDYYRDLLEGETHTFERFVKNVVLDDTQEIVDSDSPY